MISLLPYLNTSTICHKNSTSCGLTPSNNQAVFSRVWCHHSPRFLTPRGCPSLSLALGRGISTEDGVKQIAHMFDPVFGHAQHSCCGIVPSSAKRVSPQHSHTKTWRSRNLRKSMFHLDLPLLRSKIAGGVPQYSHNSQGMGSSQRDLAAMFSTEYTQAT